MCLQVILMHTQSNGSSMSSSAGTGAARSMQIVASFELAATDQLLGGVAPFGVQLAVLTCSMYGAEARAGSSGCSSSSGVRDEGEEAEGERVLPAPLPARLPEEKADGEAPDAAAAAVPDSLQARETAAEAVQAMQAAGAAACAAGRPEVQAGSSVDGEARRSGSQPAPAARPTAGSSVSLKIFSRSGQELFSDDLDLGSARLGEAAAEGGGGGAHAVPGGVRGGQLSGAPVHWPSIRLEAFYSVRAAGEGSGGSGGPSRPPSLAPSAFSSVAGTPRHLASAQQTPQRWRPGVRGAATNWALPDPPATPRASAGLQPYKWWSDGEEPLYYVVGAQVRAWRSWGVCRSASNVVCVGEGGHAGRLSSHALSTAPEKWVC